MSSTDAFNAALRDLLGPGLRAEGFKGSGSTWSAASPRSDLAVVNAQSSIYGSSKETLFVINLAVIPEPWLAFQHFGRSVPKAPKESHGLWRDRLHPSTGGHMRGSEAWWSVTDTASAERAALDALGQLKREAIPKLRRLLEREFLLASIRGGDLGFIRGEANRTFFDMAMAVLLADEGQSAELDDVLRRLADSEHEQARRSFERLKPWVEERSGRGIAP